MGLNAELVGQLRRRLKDERVGRTAFRLMCTDEAATDCLVSLTPGQRLSTIVLNGRVAASLTLDLTEPQYDSVRKVVEYIMTRPGYRVVVETDYHEEHPSADLRLMGSLSCLGEAVPFRHHIFSDDELHELLVKACARHNVGYTPEILPRQEEVFVLTLAHSEACRDLVSDAAKRRETEYTVEQLLALSDSLEKAYREDTKRQDHALPVPRPLDEGDMGRGDMVVSSSYRRSNRSGFMAPLAAAIGPTPPVLTEPSNVDIEDTKVTLRWTRNRDLSFLAYELWRDTRPDIQRPEGLSLVTDTASLLREVVKRPYTAKLCMRTLGPHSTRDSFGWVTFQEQAGQIVTQFTDIGFSDDPRNLGPATAPPLEPSTLYYYRLFAISLNEEIVASNVVAVTTKAQRALIDTTNGLTPIAGPAGTLCLVNGTGLNAVGVKAFLGGKPLILTVLGPTQMTFTVPVWTNPSFIGVRHDFVLESPNGLIDVIATAFELTE